MKSGRAHFITFEGMEGSGKSTQIRLVARHFELKGKKVFPTREPGGTELGNELRILLLRSRKEPVDMMAELFLMEAARAQHVSHVLRAALAENDLVFCDRFTDATIAYQGGGRGLDQEWIEQMNRKAAAGLVPHLTILLDMPVVAALKRALARMERFRGEKEDRFEREDRAFHEAVRETYLDLARREPERFFVVDGTAKEEMITRDIVHRIDLLLANS